jgi:hypothetical protein
MAPAVAGVLRRLTEAFPEDGTVGEIGRDPGPFG